MKAWMKMGILRHSATEITVVYDFQHLLCIKIAFLVAINVYTNLIIVNYTFQVQ